MALNKEQVIGLPTGAATVHVERGPVSKFAQSVTDGNPIYHDLAAARDAGFDSIPAPPTFTFSAASHWGVFPEDQPPDPTEGRGSPMRKIMGDLMKEGGLILHGEQEFVYHKPVQVGDTLHQEGKVVDLYSKQAKGKTMTFLVTETVFKNDAGDPVVTARFNLIHRK
ncbi:MAG: MaoC family dehydratase N-terminal domain-containing protein [Deltaproteobacteria bacterium]|nr:MaoC family dehydratase N-terminal domain-containing protein [Deltaproteobacteria bacterium]MBW2396990.1 MaoC family dehydratase N-terminal domain-containing protein [Deltaproteobacteria bacterium]